MKSADVCAVIYADTPDPRALEVVSAAWAQSRRPGLILAASATVALSPAGADARAFSAGERESAFAAGVRAARSVGCRWLWLLDGFAVPEPGALEALLAANQAASQPAPLLLASKVIDTQGRLHPDSTPRHEIFEKAHSVDAAERHLVQLRAAAHGSVLVRQAAIDSFGPPRTELPVGLDMHEWSARMLRSWRHTGYLVPASVAVRTVPPLAISWRQRLARLRVLGSPAWTPSERLWEASLIGRDVARAIRGNGRGQGRAGVGAPGFSPSRRPRRTIPITRGAKRLKRR